MAGFFKSFFASLLALLGFAVFFFLVFIIVFGSILSPSRPTVGEKAVLVIDLGQEFREQAVDNPLAALGGADVDGKIIAVGGVIGTRHLPEMQ